jgi:aminoglycoside N3'-acetyltransferase
VFKFIKKINNRNIVIFSNLLNLIDNKTKINATIKEFDKIVKILIKNNNTIVLPTYNLNFPKLKLTGYSEKFITTGILTKHILKSHKFKRTEKPMYNYAVIGPNLKTIISLAQSTAWGEDSVIGYLSNDKNTLGIGVDTDLLSFTWVSIHCCEEKLKVPYRFWKIFKGKNIDSGENVYEKMYVRYQNKKNMINLSQKIVLNKLVKDKKLFTKKGLHVKYSIINLNDYFLANLKHLNRIIK